MPDTAPPHLSSGAVFLAVLNTLWSCWGLLTCMLLAGSHFLPTFLSCWFLAGLLSFPWQWHQLPQSAGRRPAHGSAVWRAGITPVRVAAAVAMALSLSQVPLPEVSLPGCGGPVYLLRGCSGLPLAPLVPVGAPRHHIYLLSVSQFLALFTECVLENRQLLACKTVPQNENTILKWPSGCVVPAFICCIDFIILLSLSSLVAVSTEAASSPTCLRIKSTSVNYGYWITFFCISNTNQFSYCII